MSNFREALRKALEEQPDSPIGQILQNGLNEADRQRVEHERYVDKVTKESKRWRETCDDWYRIGVDYSRTAYRAQIIGAFNVGTVRQRAQRLLPTIVEWETEGMGHLFRRLSEGFNMYSPSRPNAQSFIYEFRDLFDLQNEEIEGLTPQELSGEHTRLANVFPVLSKWIKSKYGESPNP